MKYKFRVGLSVGLFLLSIGLVILGICLSQIGYLWTAYVLPITGVVLFIVSITLMPKTNKDGSPMEIKKKPKIKKDKKPILNEEEWKEQEEEDDEMMFIEEVVEDDK